MAAFKRLPRGPLCAGCTLTTKNASTALCRAVDNTHHAPVPPVSLAPLCVQPITLDHVYIDPGTLRVFLGRIPWGRSVDATPGCVGRTHRLFLL
jgi:hypothetical protein